MSVGGESTQLDCVTQEGGDLPDLVPPLAKVMVGDWSAKEHGGCEDVDSDPDVACLVDARNGLNELNRKSMLWYVRHCWPMGALYAFNCYKYAAQIVVRRPGDEALIILSKKGVTQGCPLAMILYGVALLPLSELLRQKVPEAVHGLQRLGN